MNRLPLVLAVVIAGAALWWLFSSTPTPTGGPDTPVAATDGVAARDPDLLRGDDVDPDAGDIERTRPVPKVANALRGRVEREDGSPIRGATVQAALVDPQRLRGAPFADAPPFGEATTDADGTFEMEAPKHRFLTVTASAAGFATHAVRVASHAVFAQIRLTPAGGLDVRAVDDAGKPVPEARAEAVAASTVHRAEASEGVVAFDALAPGTATVHASAPGHARVLTAPVRIVAGERAAVTVVLPRLVQVTGVVVDEETNAPIAGASVLISRPGESNDAGSTDAGGRFVATPAGGPGERQFVSVEAEGYAPALEPVVLQRSDDDATQSVVVRLRRANTWRGRVVGANGDAVPGARVGFTADGVAGRPPIETRSDDGGWFTLPPPRPPVPGRRMLLVAESQDGRAAIALRPGAVAPSPLVLRLVMDPSVYGRVRGTDGQPVAGAQIRVLPIFDRARRSGTVTPSAARLAHANEQGFAGWSTATGEDSAWRVDRVVPGTYRIQVRVAAHVVWMPDPVEVGDGDVDVGVFRLAGEQSLSGVVRSQGGEPLSGARVWLVTDTEDTRRLSTYSGSDGTYTFEHLPPGAYRVDVRLHGQHLDEPARITITDGDEQLDLTLASGAQLVVRLAGEDGRPFAGIVQVRMKRPGRPRAAQPPHTVRVQQGRALLGDLPAGVFDIEVRAQGQWARSAAPVSLRPGGTDEVALTFAKVGAIRGTVVGQDGDASAGAVVQMLDPDSGSRIAVTTDERGAFRLDALRPATYDVVVFGPGGAPATDQVSVASGQRVQVRLLLRPAGTADVRVLDPAGRPARNARVVFRSGGKLIRGVKPSRTDEQGRVRRPGLPLGQVTVSARDESGSAGLAEVEVGRDKVRSVVVRMQKPPGREGE